MGTESDRKIGELAVLRGYLSARELVESLEAWESGDGSVSFSDHLLKAGTLTMAQVTELLADIIAEQQRIETQRPAGSAPAPKLPMLAGEQFEVRDAIGHGGMGKILRVYDRHLQRTVAMKVIREDKAPEGDDLLRFVEEAQATAQLQHPGIVPIHQVGVDDKGRPYFTMREVEGKSLREVMNGLAVNEEDVAKKYSRTRMLQIFQQICYAVGYAHSKGVVHRDLKPANVMIGPFGEVFVMDWGLAKILGDGRKRKGDTTVRTTRSTGDSSRTIEGTVAGTPNYLSPEQARGQIAEIGPRSDIYTLGVMLYEMLTLERPIEADNLSMLLDKIILGKIRPFEETDPKTPKELRAIVLKAMSIRKEERYESAAQMAEDVQAYFEGRRGVAWKDSMARIAMKWIGRHKAVSTVAAVALLSLLGMSIYFQFRPGSLVLYTNPLGVEVFIDGEFADRSPVHIWSLSAGDHEVEMRMKGYRTERQTVRVGPGAMAQYEFNMYSLSGVVNFTSTPSGASVSVLTDGAARPVGKTTLVKEMIQGRRRIRMSLPGFLPHEEEIIVPGNNELLEVNVTLVKNVGRLDAMTHQDGIRLRILDPTSREEVARVALPAAEPPEVPVGEWIFRFEKNGHHFREQRVVVKSNEGVRVGVGLPSREIWRTREKTIGTVAPVVGDFNGDGMPDVAAAFRDNQIRAYRGGSGDLLWKVSASPTMGQLALYPREDGTDLLLAELSLIRVDGRTGAKTWEVPIGYPDSAQLQVIDVDGDGRLEIVVSDMTDDAEFRLAIFDGTDGRRIRSALFPTDISYFSLIRDGGKRRLLIQLIDGNVFRVNPSDLADRVRLPSRMMIRIPPSVGDIDGDGTDEIAACVENDVLALLDAGGRELWRYRADGVVCWRPAMAPGEVILSTGAGSVISLGANREVRWSAKIGKGTVSGPSLGDLEGTSELSVVIPGGDGALHVLGKGGRERWHHPLGGIVVVPPTLADMSSDGRLDLVTVLSDGALAVIDTGSGRTEWSVGTGGRVFLAPVGLNIDGDQRMDTVVAGAGQVRMGFRSTDGCELWRMSNEKSANQTLIRHGNGLATATRRSRAEILSREGGSITGLDDSERFTSISSVGDLDGDGVEDIAGVNPVDQLWVAWSGKSGAILWESECPYRSTTPMRFRSGELVSASQSAIVGLRSATGEESWRLKVDHRTPIQPPIVGKGADCLFQSSEVFRVSLRNGKPELLKRILESEAVRGASWSGGVVVASKGGRLALFSGDETRPTWTRKVPGNVTSMFCADMDGDGREEVVCGTDRGIVLALSVRGGRLFWESPTGYRGRIRVCYLNPGRIAAVAEDGTLLQLRSGQKERTEFWQGGRGPAFDGRHEHR